MRKLAPLLGLILLAAGCRTAPPARPAAAPAASSSASAHFKRYYLLKGPATVGWVSDQPFRFVSYDAQAQGDLAGAGKPASFQDLALRAKQKGYRLVATKHGP